MLSTKYRLRLEFICGRIAKNAEVELPDMIWAEKLSKANTTAREWLRKARRQASQDIEEGSIDDFNPDMPNEGLDSFMNAMDLGDPDPSNHRTEFKSADDIVEWFSQEKTDDWRQRD